ncbi:MAG TPA: purine-nucleoside phosphorylase, partial [Gemmatimonadaceae bacterium]|nr:purine-nucleoside phosphorylase [Gemmatimonadaceae bacterium]
MTTATADVAAAASLIGEQLGGCHPRIAIILGSGLGQLADRIERATNIPYADIPGFPSSTVVGHAGRLVAGSIEACDVIALSGRFHLYEGHSAATAGLPVRVAHALGARVLFVSNAAGGVRATLRPGDLMLIDDQINLMWRNPLIGPIVDGDERFPDMSAPYDRELLSILREVALDVGVPVTEGVYAAVLGPSYETPAEVRMLRWMGADAVGMSTIPEVLTARALGMRVAGVSCITNHAAGMTAQPLSHHEVLEIGERVKEPFERLVRGFVARVAV